MVRKQRTGVIAEKIGMSAIFTNDEKRIPVTLLKVKGCRVVAHKEKNGKQSLQLGFGEAKNLTKDVRGYFSKAGVLPCRILKEFVIDEAEKVPVGAEILASHFQIGNFVDVAGISIGKGFAGPMKRWNFSGLRATHGVSVSHRSHGSTGNRKSPAKVFKNKKMAGHMGCKRVSAQSLEIIEVNEEFGIICVKGAVPGFSGNYVFIKDAVKKPISDKHIFPAKYKEPESANFLDDFENKSEKSENLENNVFQNSDLKKSEDQNSDLKKSGDDSDLKDLSKNEK